LSADRASFKTFRPGDEVTVRRVVRSGKWRPCRLEPGMTGIVDRMDQRVRVRFPQSCPFPLVWVLYDGDLVLLRRP
jgi:hypothetical protein